MKDIYFPRERGVADATEEHVKIFIEPMIPPIHIPEPVRV